MSKPEIKTEWWAPHGLPESHLFPMRDVVGPLLGIVVAKCGISGRYEKMHHSNGYQRCMRCILLSLPADNLSPGDELVREARRIALEAHKGQTYPPVGYSDGIEHRGKSMPFDIHLGHVIGVLHRFGYGHDHDLVASAWLHDVLEDTTYFSGDLSAVTILNSEIDGMVRAVTDEPGATRIERKLKTYPKMVAKPKSIILKQSDRIANLESSLNGYPKYLAMYLNEHDTFVSTLAPAGGDADMWSHIGLLIEKANKYMWSMGPH